MGKDALGKPLGPYSHFSRSGPFVFVSGQIPVDKDGRILNEAGIEEQTLLTMQNLKEVLECAGSSLAKVLKVNIYLTDYSNDFQRMNSVYKAFFDQTNYPARCCVGVSQLAGGVRIEVDAIALAD